MAAPATAQSAISTDRPGFGSGTSIVAPGAVQLEVGVPGVEFDTHSAGLRDPMGRPIEADIQQRLINFPTLLRVGVTDRLEVRLESTVYNFFDASVDGDFPGGVSRFEDSDEGFGGLTVGAKVLAARPGGSFGGAVLVPSVTLPVGGDFSSSDAVLNLEGDASFALTPDLSLGTVGAISVTPSDDENNVSGLLAANLGTGFTDALGGYVEGAFQPGNAGPETGYLGAGLTYLLSPTAQLDVSFDRELTDTTGADWLFGCGVSIRFDP